MKSSSGLDYNIQEGSKKPIVFIHGWLGSKNSWKIVESNLDIQNTTIFFDQRCHGDSFCSDFEIKDLSEDLHNLIVELELDNPVIIGHSMGGMTALKYASRYDNFSGLCLLGTCASKPAPKLKSVKYFLNKFEELDRREWAEQITQNYVGDVEDEEIQEISEKELVEADSQPILYGLEAMMNYDVKGELEEFQKPCLIVAGKKDDAITMDKSRELSNILKCELETVNSGHLMLQEIPDEISDIIEDFLKE